MPRYVNVLKIQLAGGEFQNINLSELSTAKTWIHNFHAGKLAERIGNIGDMTCDLPWSVSTKAIVGMQILQVPIADDVPVQPTGVPAPLLPPPRSGF